ncbi:MAG: hypothetical protein PHS97_06780, partial [Oscillospiraceae bacterium]|nr:hypothetical protein [Oscillospiraceae bacterium]
MICCAIDAAAKKWGRILRPHFSISAHPAFPAEMSRSRTPPVEKDETYSSLNSRVIEIDINKDVV